MKNKLNKIPFCLLLELKIDLKKVTMKENIAFQPVSGTRNGKIHITLDDQNGHDIIGDNHIATSVETPLRDDAFVLNDDEKGWLNRR